MTEEAATRFSSALPIIVLSRPSGAPGWDWQEVDRGPGYFNIPSDQDIAVKIKGIDDSVLADLVKELRDVPTLRYLDLAENRNITNEGLERIRHLGQLQGLNLSSCSITSTGLIPLKEMHNLHWMILSYCNRLTDGALKTIESMHSLEYVDIQGCLGITKAALSRIRRRNLRIYR